MPKESLFHISEDGNIDIFYPRPSPSYYKEIWRDCVFAISGKLLHNYLLPRDCPRVAYYASENTSKVDVDKFFSNGETKYVVAIENNWYQKMKDTILFCYKFPNEKFSWLDKVAGYYISYEAVKPLSVIKIEDAMLELFNRNVELRILPSLGNLADDVKKSSLNFSLIRMRNAHN